MNIISHNGDIFTPVHAGPWAGLIKADVVKSDKKPAHKWAGHKITFAQVNQICSFFEWSYRETKGETIVHGFHHDEFGWAFVVLPQRGYTGMTVRLLDDHPNRIPTYQRLGEGWTPMSTWHHHCSSSAFQSTTDHDDEKTKEGLHVTVGGIGSDKYSIDLRTSFRKTILAAELTDWFVLEDNVRELIPESMHEILIKHMLLVPPKVQAFPEWWKDNVIKETQSFPHNLVYVSPSHGQDRFPNGHMLSGNYQGANGYGHQREIDKVWRYEDEFDHRYGVAKTDDAKDKQEPEKQRTCEERINEMTEELIHIANYHNVDFDDILRVMEADVFDLAIDIHRTMEKLDVNEKVVTQIAERLQDAQEANSQKERLEMLEAMKAQEAEGYIKID